MEVGEEGDYIPTATLSPPEWPALRWAAMRAIQLMFHSLWGTKSQDSVHKPQLLERKESRSSIKPRSFCLPAYCLTARPNRLSTLSIILPNAHYPSLCHCKLFSSVGAERHSCGFMQDTAAPHDGKFFGNPPIGQVVSLALSHPWYE